MAAILPRHALNSLLLISQELHVTAQWNLVRIYISMRAIYIENKKNYRYYVIRVQRSKNCFSSFMAYNSKDICSSTIKFGQQVFPVSSNEYPTNGRAAAGHCMYWKQDHCQQWNPATSHVILDKEAFDLREPDFADCNGIRWLNSYIIWHITWFIVALSSRLLR